MGRNDDMKNPFTVLSENTTISVGLLVVCGSLVIGACGWAYNQSVAMNDIRYELKELRQMIQAQWTKQDHDIFALQLALKNPNLEVPLSMDNKIREYPTKNRNTN